MDFFDRGSLTDDALAYLRAKKHDVRKPNTDGYMYFQGVMAWKNPDNAERFLQSERFRKYLVQVIGIGPDLANRAASVIKNISLQDEFLFFTATPYGSKHFQWSPAEKIMNSKFESVCPFLV